MGQNSSKKTPIVPTPSEIPTNNGICVLPFPKSLTTNTTPTNLRTEAVSSRVAQMSEMSTEQRAEAVSSWVTQTTTNISGHYTTTTVPHARKEIPKTESRIESFNKKLPALALPPEANLNGPIAIVKPEKKPAPLIPLKPIIIEGSRFAEIKAEGLDVISLADRMDAMAILTTQGTTKQIQQQARVNGSVPKDKSKSFKYDHYGKLIDGHELGEDLKQETNVVAIDCEMVGVGELCDSALARVSIVNRYGFCIYDRFVKPRLPVTDYRTNKSGVREEDLVNAPDHYVVIEEVRSILHEKIVVGHSVHNDFEVLEFVHPEAMTRDTAIYYKELLHKKTSPSLKQLSNKYFNTKIQGGEHSSIVDAQVTMLLYSREELNWESSLNKQNETHMENPMPTKIPKIGVMTIYPRRDDLEGDAQYVRPIQVDTPYNCHQHYIDTMFRLLREDFMKPLREGYKQYLRWIQTKQSKDKPTTVRIFEGVKVNLGRGSLELKNVQQITIPMRQGNWDLSSTSEESRFLVNGSMLLFIPNTMYSGGAKVATVMRANEDDDKRFAKQGILKVLFFPDGPSWTVQESTRFTVLESVAFFEAYRYALDSLQTLNLSKLPLGKYILNPTIPFGSVQSDFRSFDFSSQIVQLMPGSNGEYQYDGFPSSVQLGLSKGQYEAYHSAITKELALIQGPPGTGKTFIAMKIITFFLHNPALLAGRPILIVSNTNHSLDHLMEKVVNYATFMTGSQRRGDSLVLRIGGRSKSEIVTRVSLREKEQAYTRKTEAATSLARARRNYILLQKLNSIQAQLQVDILETSKVLKRAQDYLRDPEVKNVQKVLPEPDSAGTKESRLRACLYEATESINGAIGSNNLVLAQLGCAKLQRTAALPLLMKVVEDKVKLLEKEVEELKDVTNILQAMRAARVIGGTVCGFTKQKTRVLDKVKPALIIVEEAAHIVESTVVAGLTDYSKRLILIGDHKQLRPSTADHALTVANHLDVSIMERFVQTAEAQGLKTWSQLDVQRRMRPEIARLICPTIYTELYNDPSVNHFPNVKGMHKNLFFVYHDERDEKEKDSMSYVNIMEAQFLTNLCLYLIAQGNEPRKITIITTYLGQKFEIENRMKRSTKYSKDVRVCCVDGFQGEENDIILLSLVRSNDERNIGFLRTNNRVCVALSRARHGLYIVGNMHGLATRSATWREINNTLMQGDNIGPLLRLKCVFHGGRITSVGMNRSHQQLDFMRNGTMNKCVCDLKQAQGRNTPTLKNSIIIQNSQLTATNSTVTESLPQSRTLSAASSLSSLLSFQSTGPRGAEGHQTNGVNEKLGCGKKFTCGHFCNQKCKKPSHKGYKCLEPCIRICNGGHKCPGNHHCYLPCQNLIKCQKKITVACSNCSKMVNGVCSVLKPYYGKQSPLRHISGKTFCDPCK